MISILLLKPSPVQAVFLSQASVRLDRLKTGETLSGLVCAQPSAAGAGVENSVEVTFPADFNINSNAATWTISGFNLPSGSVFWPSADILPVVVSGQTVIVTGGDLTTTDLYCFRFTSTSTIGPSGNKKGTMITKTSGGSVINDRGYGLQILSDDQISVTGKVPARPLDLQNSLEQITTGDTHIQDVTLEYRIMYGTYLAYSTDLTLQASWSLGTVSGDSAPTVDLLEYADGTASPAYAGTPAIVDTNNRTITWNISSFPANTVNQSVRFKLRTKSDYRGKNKVAFTITGQTSNEDTSTPNSGLTGYYQYNPSQVVAAPVYGSDSSASLPEPSLPQNVLYHVSTQSVSVDEAVLAIVLNQPAQIILNYGPRSNLLNRTITSLDTSRYHYIKIDGLLGNSPYYFDLIGNFENRQLFTSSLYTFKTASVRQKLTYDPTSFFALGSGGIIFDRTYLPNPAWLPNLVVPKDFDYQIKFTLDNPVLVDRVSVSVENKRVLGLATSVFAAEPSTKNVDVIETVPNTFSTRLKSPQDLGEYEIYAKATDISNNQTTTKIAELTVTDYLTVLNTSGHPIEGAQISFYLYNPQTRLYKFLAPQLFPIRNPDYTDSLGRIRSALPPLHYLIKVNAIGYKSQETEFTVGQGEDNYPVLKLTPERFILFTNGVYYFTILSDALQATRAYIQSLAASSRFFELSGVSTIAFFIFISLLSFRARIRIPFSSFFTHLWQHLTFTRIQKTRQERIWGQVIDQVTQTPVHRAAVFLFNPRGQVVGHTMTNSGGRFVLLNPSSGSYRLQVLKDGYEILNSNSDNLQNENNKKVLILTLTTSPVVSTLMVKIKTFGREILSVAFEVFLLLSLIFEVSFGFAFTWSKALPFLLISLTNLVLWLIYSDHLQRLRGDDFLQS